MPSYKTSHQAKAPAAAAPKKVSDLAAGLRRSSCAEESGPLPPRDLTPLQKRQLMMKNKATFTLTPQAVRRVRYLIEKYKEQQQQQHQNTTGETETVFGTPDGIRIGVRRRGCSGYSYTVNYHFSENGTQEKNTTSSLSSSSSSSQQQQQSHTAADAKTSVWNLMEKDSVVEQEGLKVVVAADALFYVIGTVMDYVVLNVEEKFVFRNPNKKYSCGCEESFMPFDSEDMEED